MDQVWSRRRDCNTDGNCDQAALRPDGLAGGAGSGLPDRSVWGIAEGRFSAWLVPRVLPVIGRRAGEAGFRTWCIQPLSPKSVRLEAPTSRCRCRCRCQTSRRQDVKTSLAECLDIYMFRRRCLPILRVPRGGADFGWCFGAGGGWWPRGRILSSERRCGGGRGCLAGIEVREGAVRSPGGGDRCLESREIGGGG